jgi:predicted metal-dependent phosphoesterase TrpH
MIERIMARVDMHSHTKGSDGTGTPESIALAARDAGLDVLCLTDHHNGRTEEAHAVAVALRAAGVLPILGVEYSTAEGHLLVYGVEVDAKRWGFHPPMQELVRWTNDQGGFCVAPHPYKVYQRYLGDKLPFIMGLAAIEVLNGQVEVDCSALNRRANQTALQLGASRVGGSDAHHAFAVGATYTYFPGKVADEKAFLSALKSGTGVPRRNASVLKRCLGRPSTASSCAQLTGCAQAKESDASSVGAKSRHPRRRAPKD